MDYFEICFKTLYMFIEIDISEKPVKSDNPYLVWIFIHYETSDNATTSITDRCKSAHKR